MGRCFGNLCAADAHDAGVRARCFGKRRAADAHDAGPWAGALESDLQLMLMMLGLSRCFGNLRVADLHDARVWRGAFQQTINDAVLSTPPRVCVLKIRSQTLKRLHGVQLLQLHTRPENPCRPKLVTELPYHSH